ncbi:MAG: nucleotidyl transferase AbiEii/AbiGii toxin family protein [Candidatus Omnitrophota bacterium]|nr:nucleotidyl transferase AbiEii/AbiGii toxin family protein [Candidatus Omnitrophota bacterium]
MSENIYTSLQLREVFHLELLRCFGRKIKPEYYSLKGGVNLRFFFNSFRYSEDMDLDIQAVRVEVVCKTVMDILESVLFKNSLIPFGVKEIIPPDIVKAKQTQTTQRFKVHLISPANEDFFTKIEFSRRGFKGKVVNQVVQNSILRLYKSPPLVVPHYDILSAIAQKINALSARTVIQARDIFDLYILMPQYKISKKDKLNLDEIKLNTAHENIFEVSVEQFRDTVLAYLSIEDQKVYNADLVWDEIKLKVAGFIEELRNYV